MHVQSGHRIPLKPYLIYVILIILSLAFSFLALLHWKGFENGTMKANLLKLAFWFPNEINLKLMGFLHTNLH